MQHAIGSRPDPAHGYCADDVARALEVDLLHARVLGWPAVADSAGRGLALPRRRLRRRHRPLPELPPHRRLVDRRPGVRGQPGRAMLALGETIAAAPDRGWSSTAAALFAVPSRRPATSPRRARRRRSCLALRRRVHRVSPDARTRLGCATLDAAWRTDSTTGSGGRAEPGWPWPEVALTYENALLPRALIVAGRVLGVERDGRHRP